MSRHTPGKLERIEGATMFDRSADLVRWLSEPEILAQLGEALGLRLEPAKASEADGAPTCSLICREADTGREVVVEARLGSGSAAGLGALITRAARRATNVALLIAERLGPDERHALTWLAGTGGADVRFVGVEVELWRIGESPIAPRFVVVAGPDASESLPRVSKGPLSPDLEEMVRERPDEAVRHLLEHLDDPLLAPALFDALLAAGAKRETCGHGAGRCLRSEAHEESGETLGFYVCTRCGRIYDEWSDE